MGSLYAKNVLGYAKPRVGVVNNGEEDTKGNELTQGAHKLLKNTPQVNYIGFIEGRDLCQGTAQVILCDGFIGNILLKFAEGLSQFIFDSLKQEIESNLRHKLGAALLLPGLQGMKKRLDYTEYGGAPLLGVNGLCIIAHGSSNSKAIKNAIGVCAQGISTNVLQGIAQEIEQMDGDLNEGNQGES